MKNTGKPQPKQIQGQGKPKVQQGQKKQTLQSQPPPVLTVPAPEEKYRRLFDTAQDTGRKQAEEAQHEDELLYRNIFEGVQDAIFVEIPSGKILDVNQRACEMFGYSRQEFLTKSVLELVSSEKNLVPFNPDDPFPVPDHPVETINVRANGEQFPIEISIRLQKQKGETVLIVVGRDITERKHVEEELANVKTTLEAAFEQTPVPMVMVSMPDAMVRIVNSVCRRVTGHYG